MSGDAGLDELEAAARAARARAYAPYSGYAVGAALRTKSGRIYAGCNVENASYGLCLCAERSAVAQMVAAGEREPVAIAVVTAGPVVGTPCGMCRQTLAEFARDMPVRLAVDAPGVPAKDTTLAALLPDAFRADALAKG
ncbi:MAG TPA: cytidine deaminase [Minicystis sp.]|nr:cytidine deaminase [Minicystis sp.]